MTNNLFQGYSHIGVYVTDREKAIQFYQDVLSFDLLFKVDNESDGLLIAMLQLGNCYVEVLEPPQGRENIVPGAMSSVNHIGIVVTDIDKACSHVESFGYSIENRGIYDVPRFGRPDLDLKVAFFRGPNGERIELFQELYRK